MSELPADNAATPKVSVLLPVYNAEKFVAEAIDSILSQTFADFEFIIINDGSTDRTAEIIRNYKDSRIRFFDNRKNQGLIAALNQGLDIALGEYIARMDADDIAYPERLARQIEFMDANCSVGIVSSNVRIFGDRFGELGDKRNEDSKNPISLGVLDWFHGCKLYHPAAMMRISFLKKFNLHYNPDYIACEDYELWSRAARYTKIVNIQDVLLNYRWHDGSVTTLQRNVQLENTKRVQDNILNFCISDEKDRLLYRFFAGGSEDALCVKIHLFGIFPLFSIKAKRTSKKIFFINFIPLIKIKNRIIYLFFIFPILTITEIEHQASSSQTIEAENYHRSSL